MSKKLTIIFISIFVIVLVGTGIFYVLKNNKETIFENNINETDIEWKNNMMEEITAVVINVNDAYNCLDVMVCKKKDKINSVDSYYLKRVKFAKECNIDFKRGQEILVNFKDENTITTGFESIVAKKIQIIKDKSDIEIPKEVLRLYESSYNNVSIQVKEFTNTGIAFVIIDKNEIPYEYTNHRYKIEKKEHDEEYIWKELEVGTVFSDDTEVPYDVSNLENENNFSIFGRKFDWTEMYGELCEGEYHMYIFGEDDFSNINIYFTINEEGEVSCNSAELSL